MSLSYILRGNSSSPPPGGNPGPSGGGNPPPSGPEIHPHWDESSRNRSRSPDEGSSSNVAARERENITARDDSVNADPTRFASLATELQRKIDEEIMPERREATRLRRLTNKFAKNNAAVNLGELGVEFSNTQVLGDLRLFAEAHKHKYPTFHHGVNSGEKTFAQTVVHSNNTISKSILFDLKHFKENISKP